MIKVGVIAGSFDVLHPGYIEMFKDARTICDRLVVLLNEGSNMEQYDKPTLICSVHERRDRLLALRYVDKIITYKTEVELASILKILAESDTDRKYIRILGTDYLKKPFTGDDLELDIYFHNRDKHGWSTTIYKNLIAESLNLHKKEKGK